MLRSDLVVFHKFFKMVTRSRFNTMIAIIERLASDLPAFAPNLIADPK